MGRRGWWRRVREWVARDRACYFCRLTVACIPLAAVPAPACELLVCDLRNVAAVTARIVPFPPSIAEGVRQNEVAVLAVAGTEWRAHIAAAPGPRVQTVFEHTVTLGRHDAYVSRLATHPAWRGQGLAPAVIIHLATELATRGIETLYFFVETSNIASLRAFEKCGAERIGLFFFHRRYGRWRSDLCLFPDTAPLPRSSALTGGR